MPFSCWFTLAKFLFCLLVWSYWTNCGAKVCFGIVKMAKLTCMNRNGSRDGQKLQSQCPLVQLIITAKLNAPPKKNTKTLLQFDQTLLVLKTTTITKKPRHWKCVHCIEDSGNDPSSALRTSNDSWLQPITALGQENIVQYWCLRACNTLVHCCPRLFGHWALRPAGGLAISHVSSPWSRSVGWTRYQGARNQPLT